MSMTSAADARSQAVSPALILSMAGKPERLACPGQRRLGVTKVAIRSWRPSRSRPTAATRLLHAPSESDDVALGVGEHRDEAFRLLQGALKVGHVHVERHDESPFIASRPCGAPLRAASSPRRRPR